MMSTPAAATMEPSTVFQIDSPRFGTLEIHAEQVLHFGEGILGFPDLRRFVRIAPESCEPLEFLVPVDEPRLAFPLLNPYLVNASYDFDLNEPEQRAIGLAPGGAILVYCVATLGTKADQATVNLLAPILINPENRRGRQLVLEGTCHSTAAPLFDKG